MPTFGLMPTMKDFFTFWCAFLSFFGAAYSQDGSSKQEVSDTIVLMNGELVPCEITDSSLYGAKAKVIDRKGRSRELLFEGERVFSLKFSDGKEKIIYRPDLEEDAPFTVQEARYFIIGERDAMRGFRSPVASAGGFVVGLASGSVGTMLSLIPPFAYSGIMLLPKVKVKRKTVSDESLLKYDTYLLGYERVARRRKAINSFKTGIVGAAIGLAINQFILK